MLWNILLDTLTQGSIYFLISVGLTMVYGILKILHIAHAAVYTIGAGVGLGVFRLTGNFWLALVAAMVVSGGVGMLIYRGVYFYMLDQPRIVPLITSVGLFLLIQDLLQKPFLMGPYQHAFPAQDVFPSLTLPWGTVPNAQVMIIALTGVTLLLLYLIFTRTRLGLAWQAASQDREMAGAVGINLNTAVALNFLLGSALAGAAGVLVGVFYNSVYATMGDVPSYKAFVVIVLGGMGSVTGTVAASFLLALAETVLLSSVGYVLPRDAIAFLVLILVLMFRPQGLLGR